MADTASGGGDQGLFDVGAFYRPLDRDALIGPLEPLGSLDQLVIEDLTDDEADAFWAALEA